MALSSWIFIVLLLGVVGALIYFFAVAPKQEQELEQSDPLANGQGAVGTVVAIDHPASVKGSNEAIVTVEFTPPGYPEPTRFETAVSADAADKLEVNEPVLIHYLEQNPPDGADVTPAK